MRIKEIILDKKEPTVYCESFVYEASNVEEEKFGRLFMVGRIRNVPENSFYLINLLASRIKREYYNLRYQSSYQAFEAALREGNKVLKENEDRINWLGNLDFLIATINEKKIYFTLIGKMKSFIVRSDQIIDLVKNVILEKDVLFPFSTILQSNIKKDDIVIISTSNIFTKDLLIERGKDLIPVDEEKIARLIEPEESGVSLVVETGKTSEVVERLKPTLEVSPHPMVLPGFNIPKKEQLKRGFEKSKSFIKNITVKGKEKLKPGIQKVESSIKEKKEEVAPRIAIEKMHYSSRFKNKISKIFKTKAIPILIFIILIAGIVFGRHQQRINVQIKTIEKTITMVKSKQTEAESYLVYGDKEKAINSLIEGLSLLQSIKNPLTKKEEVEKLESQIDKKIAKIVGRKILTELKPIFKINGDETNEVEIKKWNQQEMISNGNNIYVFSKNSPFVYQQNLETGVNSIDKKDSPIIGGTMLNKKPFFLLSPTSVIISNQEKTFPISFAYEPVSVTELGSFNKFLYILDSEKGEITKYLVGTSKLGKPNLWLKQRSAAKGAVSFAIDGNIYLLFKDGKIAVYGGGYKKGEFNSPKTYPEIESASKIFTSEDNKYIYIADPKNKRIVVIDENGKIFTEYESSQFKAIKDVWVDAGDKNIYVLSGLEVFKIPLSK